MYYCSNHKQSEVDNLACRLMSCSKYEFSQIISDIYLRSMFLQNEVTQIAFTKNAKINNKKIIVICLDNSENKNCIYLNTYISPRIEPHFYGFEIRLNRKYSEKALALIKPHVTDSTFRSLLKH
jgi:hypothetical protein